MADKKINQLPDESTMTTPDADKLIFIGDPANGKLYHGLKSSGSQNLQQVTDAGFTTTNPIEVIGASLGAYVTGTASIAALDSAGYLLIKTGGLLAFLRATNITDTDKDIELPDSSGTLVISVSGNYANGTGNILFTDLQSFTNNAAAISAGLPVGALYRNGDDLRVVHE